MDSLLLRLLGRFEVIANGVTYDLPLDAQRVLAFLALRRSRLPRDFVAGTIWIAGAQPRANGNLRSALWRLRKLSDDLVDGDVHSITLGENVAVDIDDVRRTTQVLCDYGADVGGVVVDPASLGFDLLPGWSDDWLLVERERIRQESLHALESIADRLAAADQHGEAIEAALLAVRLDPLRESAHRCIVRIHLGEGNRSAAVRHVARYSRALDDRLGLCPTARMTELVRFG